MSYGTVEVSNNILRRAFEETVEVTPMKLQRLLYVVASEYAKRTGERLFDEDFVAWAYGPVLLSIHHHFAPFSGGAIRMYGKTATSQSYAVDEASDSVLAQVLDEVWRNVKDVPPVILSRLLLSSGSVCATTVISERVPFQSMKADTSYSHMLGLVKEVGAVS